MGSGNQQTSKQSTVTSVIDNKVTGGDNSLNTGATTLQIGKKGSIGTYNDPVILTSALGTVKDVVSATLEAQVSNRTADNAIFEKFQGQSDSTLSAIKNLAETKITDGANITSKTTLIAMAIGGAVILFSLRKR